MLRTYYFTLLWAGQALALLGDAFYVMALVTVIYGSTGDAAAAALVPAVRVAALFVGGALAPIGLARLPLLRFLKLAQLYQCLWLALAAVLAAGHASPAWLLVPLALSSLADGCIALARQALVPVVVPRERLVAANGLMAVADQTAQFAGWASGGLLAAFMGGAGLLWWSLGLQACSAASVYLLGRDAEPAAAAAGGTAGAGLRAWGADMRRGWAAILASPPLRTLAACDLADGLAGGVWAGAIMLAFVQDRLGQGEAWWGYLNAAYLVGATAGGLAALTLSARVERSLPAVAAAGAALSALLTAGFGAASEPWLAALLCGLLGLPWQAMEIARRSLVQRATPAALLPVVLSALGSVKYVSFGLSVLALGALSDAAGASSAYMAAAGLLALSALYCRSRRSALLLTG